MATRRGQSILRWWLGLFTLVLCFTIPAGVLAANLSWLSKAPLPAATSRAAAGVVNGKLYVLGGSLSGADTSSVYAYDPGANSWQPLTSLPNSRFAAAEATSGDTIYLAGGGGYSAAASTVIAYNTGTGVTNLVGNLVTPRMRAAAAILNGKMYVVGGYKASPPSSSLDTIEEIDITSGSSTYGTSTTKKTLPGKRELPAVAVANGKLYIFGGSDESGAPTKTCWEYDPTTDNLVTKNPMPLAWSGKTAAVGPNGKIYLAGNVTSTGFPPTSWNNDVLEYDPLNDTWQTVGTVPTSRYAAVAAIIGTTAYVVGGDTGTGPTAVNEAAVFGPPPLSGGFAWMTLPPMQQARIGAASAFIDRWVCLFGGSNRIDPPPAGALSSVEAYDTINKMWVSMPPLPEPRFSAASAVQNGVVYLVGGTTVGGPGYGGPGYTNTVIAYDTWNPLNGVSVVGNINIPRFRSGAAMVNNKIYVFGGAGYQPVLDSAEEYDIASNTSISKTPLPAPRDLPGVIRFAGSRIFIFGGFDQNGQPTNTVWEYLPASDTYVWHMPMPIARGGDSGVVALNGKIYVIGGAVTAGPPPISMIQDVQEFDPWTETWKVIGSLPSARWGFSSVFEEDHGSGNEVAYIMGGSDNNQVLATNEIGAPSGSWNVHSVWSPNSQPPRYSIDWDATAHLPLQYNEYVKIAGTYYHVRGSGSGSWSGTGYNAAVLDQCDQRTGSVPLDGTGQPIWADLTGTQGQPIMNYSFWPRMIDIMPPFSVITSPSDGAWTTGPVVITGIASDSGSGVFRVDVSTDGGVTWHIAVDQSGGSWSSWNYRWQPQSSGTYTIQCRALDKSFNFQSYPYPAITVTVQADTTPPVTYITAPANGEIITGTSYTIGGPSTDGDGSGVQRVEVSIDGGPWQVALENSTSGYPLWSSWKYIWSPLPASGSHTIQARGVDNAGNVEFSGASVTVTVGTAGEWDVKAPMPVATARAVSGVVNGKIFVIGGNLNDGSNTAAVHSYDTVTDTWQTLSTFCTALVGPASAQLGTDIFVAGGDKGGAWPDALSSSIYKYDALSGTCAPIGNLVTPRFRMNAAQLNGKMYVVGGYGPEGLLDTIEEIDLATGASTIKTTLPEARTLAGVSAANGKLYIFGGSIYGASSAVTWEYDPLTNQFATKNPMLIAGEVRSSALVNGKIYVVGDMNQGQLGAGVQEYDPLLDRWTMLTSVPTVRFATVTEVVNEVLYVIGGFDQQSPALSLNESYNFNPLSWTVFSSGPPVPNPFNLPASSAIDWLLSQHPQVSAMSYLKINGTYYSVVGSSPDSWNGLAYTGAALAQCDQTSGHMLTNPSTGEPLWANTSGMTGKPLVLNGSWPFLPADATPPITTITSPANGAVLPSAYVTLNGTATDGQQGSGIASVEYSIDGGPWSMVAGSSSWTYSFWLSEGAHSITSRACDRKGNCELTFDPGRNMINVTVDSYAPTVSINSPTGGSVITGSSVIVTATANDGSGSGVASVSISTDAGATWQPASLMNGNWYYNWTVPADGVFQLQARACDYAALCSTAVVTVTRDATPPTVNVSINGQVPAPWYSSDVTVSITATDNVMGLDLVEYDLDGHVLPYTAPFVVSSEMAHRLTVRARDRAYNQTEQVFNFGIDRTLPSTSASVSCDQGQVGWCLSAATITLSASDSLSGIQATEYKVGAQGAWTSYTAPFTVAQQGVSTIFFSSKDSAGNLEQPEKQIQVKVDRLALEPWTSIGPYGAGIRTMVVSPNYATDRTIFAGSSNTGVYRSTDGGASWVSVNAGLTNGRAYSLAISPNYGSDRTLFAGAYEGVYRSTDGGQTWTLGNGLPSGMTVISLVVSPDFSRDGIVIAGTENAGIYRSIDGGNSWNSVFSSNWAFRNMAISPNFASDKTVYAGSYLGGGVFRSIDGGTTWTQCTILSSVNNQIVNLGVTNTGVIFAVSYNGTYSSNDGGVNWTAVATAGGVVAASPNFANDGTIIIGAARSTDSGATWTTLSNNGGYSYAFSPAFATDGTIFTGSFALGVLRSTDRGDTWTLTSNGMLGVNVTAVTHSPAYATDRTMFVAANPGGVFRSMDGGLSWQPVNQGMTDTRMVSVSVSPDFVNDHTVYAFSDYGYLFKSTDSGDNWARITGSFPSQGKFVAVSPNYASDRTVFIGGQKSYNGSQYSVLRSVDGGTTWQTVINSSNGDLYSIAFSPAYATDHTVFMGTRYGVSRSTNSGLNWTSFSVTGTSSIYSLALSPTFAVDQTLYAGTWFGVYRSIDGGVTWSAINNGIPVNTSGYYVQAYAVAISPNYQNDHTIFAGTDSGVFQSSDAGASWAPVNDGLPSLRARTLAVSPTYVSDKKILTGLYYGSVWSRSFVAAPASTITSPVNGATLSSRTVSITGMATDGNGSGIAAVEVSIDGGVTWNPANGTTAWTYTANLPTDGTFLLLSRARDVAGNIGAPSAPVSISIDTTPPVLNVDFAGTLGTSGWYTSDVAVTVTATDNLIGIVSVEYDLDGQVSPYSATFTVNGEMIHRLTVRAKDRANHVTEKVFVFGIDKTAPTGTIIINNGAAFTTSSDVTLTLSGVDANGVSTMQFSNDGTTWIAAEAYATTKTWTLSAGDGQKTIFVRYQDMAGNWSTAVIRDDIVKTTNITAWTWGNNNHGQLGDGTIVNGNIPGEVYGQRGFVAAAGGYYHTLGLKSDGTVLQWGYVANVNSPVPALVDGLSGITAVAAGGVNSVALKSDGSVWTWGANWGGQLGPGNRSDPDNQPGQVSGISEVKAISAGQAHTVALKTDGTVWAWGYNVAGALGNGMNNNSSVPVQAIGLDGVVAISAGDMFTMALKSDGTVWAWGNNDYGNLGDGTNVSRNVPAQVPGLSGISAVAAGYSHAMALSVDGKVWVWGSNYHGELGDGTTVAKNRPVQIAGLSGVTAIAAGSMDSAVLKGDGTVLNWGALMGGDTLSPALVAGVTDAIAIATGAGHTIVLRPFDVLAPVSTIKTPAPNAVFNGASYAITGTASAGSGIKTVEVSFDNGQNWNTASGASSWTYTWTLPADGSYTIKTRTTDTANVIETERPGNAVTVVVDNTPPVSTLSLTGTTGDNGWFISTVDAAIGAIDNLSGVLRSQYHYEGKSWSTYYLPLHISTEGSTNLYYRSLDKARNNEAEKMQTVKVDTVPPVTTAVVSCTAGLNSMCISNATITLAATDSTSGVALTEYSINAGPWTAYAAPFTVSAEGATTVSIRSKDVAGNPEIVKTQVITIDKTAPTGSITINGGAGYTNTVAVTLSLSATDASGIAQMQFSNDNTTWSAPEAYAASKAWTLATGDGSKTVYVKYQDGAGLWSAAFSASITLYSPLVIITPNPLPDAYVGILYSKTLDVTGGVVPYSWGVLNGSTLPSGLSMSTSGTISGTPLSAGNFNFSALVTDQTGSGGATKPFGITIYTQPQITTASPLRWITGVTTSIQLSATGGKDTYTWSIIGSLPAGLTLNASTGIIAGSPTVQGTFTVTARVADANNVTNDKQFTMYINPPLAITSSSPLPWGITGVAYSQQLTATGGKTPYAWTLTSGSLPTGLSLSAAGLMSGTPTAAGSFTFTVTLNDAVGTPAVSKAFTIDIFAPFIISAQTLPNGTTGTSYSYTLTATGGKTSYGSWTLASGGLPTGLTLSSAGIISGTPSASGTFTFTVRATDANGTQATSPSLSITIAAAPLVITSTSPLLDAYKTVAYNVTLVASGGKAPYTWSLLSGSSLPAGLTLSTAGVISGTPTSSAATKTFTVQVKDANNTTVTKSLTINVYTLPTVSTASLADGYLTTAYSQTLAATNGKTPYSWSISAGALPSGLILSSAGVISGTPMATGTFNFTVVVADANGKTASKALSIVIYALPTITTNSPMPDGFVSSAYSQTMNVTGGKSAYTWSLVTGSTLPAGLTLSTAGVISGTPTTAVSKSFTVQVKDANNVIATKSLTLTIQAARPDLMLTAVSGPSNGTRGSSISVSSTVKNQGGANAGSFTVTFYLSTDSTITTGDVVLGEKTVTSLNTGSSSTVSGSFAIPTSIAAGTYYIGAIADSKALIVETDENNNALAASKTITVK